MQVVFNKSAMVALVGAAVFSASSVAAAPSRAGDDPAFQDSGLTSIAPIEGRGYLLEARVRTLYDSNIVRNGDGIPLNPGASRSDFRISPLVTAAIGVPVGRQQVFLGGEIGRDYYVNNTQLNRNRYAIGGGVNLRAGTRCTGAVATDFNSRLVLLSDLAEVIPSVQEKLTYGASAQCQGPIGIGFGGSVRRLQNRNSGGSRQLFDLDSTIFSPNVSYALGNLGRFSVSASLNQVDYVRRSVLLPSGTSVGDGVDIRSGRFGFERAVGSRLAITLGLSYLESKPNPKSILTPVGVTSPPAEPGFILGVVDRSRFSGLGYDGSISYTPSPRLGATIAAGRNVSASANVGAQYQVRTNVSLDLDYRLGSAISVGSGMTFDKNKYFNSFISDNDSQRRLADKITRVYGSVSYAPVPLYSLSLLLAYQDRKSDPVEFSYKSFAATLTLNVKIGREK
jgi:hypothetical protein